MLRTLGELPRNNTELVEASRRYFGERWAHTLSAAALSTSQDRDSMIALSRRIDEQYESFQDQAQHLQRFAAMPSAPERLLAALGAQIFRELAPTGAIEREVLGVDLRVVVTNGEKYLIEFKSTRGPLSDIAFRRAIRALEHAKKLLDAKRAEEDVHLILVVNVLSELPPSARAAEDAELERLRRQIRSRWGAPEHGGKLSIVSGQQLLRDHNRLHLEEAPAWEILRNLRNEDRKSSATNIGVG
jgi:hypothetical protein